MNLIKRKAELLNVLRTRLRGEIKKNKKKIIRERKNK